MGKEEQEKTRRTYNDPRVVAGYIERHGKNPKLLGLTFGWKLKSNSLPLSHYPPQMNLVDYFEAKAGAEGIEPPFSVLETEVLPLNDAPIKTTSV
jgi:hypothetical protein